MLYTGGFKISILARDVLLERINIKLNWLCFNLQNDAKRGLLDGHIHSENFIKELLNVVYGYNLININATRSNEPGIDLGDIKKKVAFQVTGQKTKLKIDKTLKNVVENNKHLTYPEVYIMVLGQKQKTYAAFNSKEAKVLKFQANKHIIDISDIQRDISSFAIAKVRDVYTVVNGEIRGVYETIHIDPRSILMNVEEPPKYTYSNCKAMQAYYENNFNIKYTSQEMRNEEAAIKDLYDILYYLPKSTRELFYLFVVNSKKNPKIYSDAFSVDSSAVQKIFNGNFEFYKNDYENLIDNHLISKADQTKGPNLGPVILDGKCAYLGCLEQIKQFIDAHITIDAKSVFVELDFSFFAI